MSNISEYKCPCCNGIISFDSQIQKMKCSYCGTELTVEGIEAYNQSLQEQKSDMSWQQPNNMNWTNEEKEQLVSYSCQSCGGEIITDKNTIATSCPYCDNKIVINEQVQGILKPDLVIPFHFDKQAACQSLKEHFNNKKLLPQSFKNENHIEEIKGVYVPYWLFDCHVDGDYNYNANRIHGYSDGDYQYTTTDHFMLKRRGSIEFSKVPTDGSSKIADELMDSLEPFDYSQAVDFSTAYLAGYLADRYDVSSEQSYEKVNNRINNSVNQLFNQTTLTYGGAIPTSHSIQLQQNQIQYALLPVWILNTTWNNQKYVFVMNGQTGKFIGDLPVDNKLYWKYFGIYFGVGTLITTLVSMFFI